MLDHSAAHSRATNYLREKMTAYPCAIVDAHTQEHPFGWVFFYQSVRYLQTHNFSDRLAGNAPLIVNRLDGSIHVLGTAQPVDFYIKRYVEALQRNGSTNKQTETTSTL